jgi:phosphoenolpyruvate synthase/pyruvate phosphate dikinase
MPQQDGVATHQTGRRRLACCLPLSQVDRSMIDLVGGKAANLGDMIQGSFTSSSSSQDQTLTPMSIPVPPGFVVTSMAFGCFMDEAHTHAVQTQTGGMLKKVKLQELFQELDQLTLPLEAEDTGHDVDFFTKVRELGAKIRTFLEQVSIPEDVSEEIATAWRQLQQDYGLCHGADSEEKGTSNNTNNARTRTMAVAVRSSATAEDLPSASFAGQHDTYLNVTGYESVMWHIRCCWISLFTDRAIVYRLKNQFDHNLVKLCVVVQAQINPSASGIMFTANVMSGKRSDTMIEAGFGLGEALVSGLINADSYNYDRASNQLTGVSVGDKSLEIVIIPAPVAVATTGITADESETGKNKNKVITVTTQTRTLDESRRKAQVLNETQVMDLVQMGETIQGHYQGTPQDIEWCIEHDTDRLFIVQSRTITTLFPYPTKLKYQDDNHNPDELRVYISFGHMQVMTSPFTPCGRSLWHSMLGQVVGRDPDTGESYTLRNAGACYLYGDLTRLLQIPAARRKFLSSFQHVSAGMAASVETIVERDYFQATRHSCWSNAMFIAHIMFSFMGLLFARVVWRLFFQPNPEGMKQAGTEFLERRVQEIRKRVRAPETAEERFRVALEELQGAFFDVQWLGPFAIAGMASHGLVRSLVMDDVTDDGSTDEAVGADLEALRRGLSGNVTTDMDLKIGDLADVARSEPATAAWLQEGTNLTTSGLEDLAAKEGTDKFRNALSAFLDQYGCRCAGEIDMGRQRWMDDPSSVLQVIRGNLTNNEPGHHRAHHERLFKAGEEAAKRLIDAAPWYKRVFVTRFVRIARSLGALREHHKFLLIQILYEVRRAVIDVASLLEETGDIARESDVWMLTLDEIEAALQRDEIRGSLKGIVSKRKEEFERESKLKPPAVLTSEGECVTTQPNNDHVPEGALGGLAVSSGVVEGVAKVVIDPTTAVLHSGEILVCPCTDPGWTPLFINAAGIVMEVGGYLTHGSVVSREYGIPAVSCIATATTTIKTGMKLRVDGSRGFVQILDDNKEDCVDVVP